MYCCCAHLAPAEAGVDGLVNINHAGMHVPPEWVLHQRHVVGKSVGAVFWKQGHNAHSIHTAHTVKGTPAMLYTQGRTGSSREGHH